MRLRSSIQGDLSLFTGVLLLLLVAVAGSAMLGLRAVDRSVEAINGRWLAGTQMLGELSDRMSEFRLTETYRALAPDHPTATAIEALARGHRMVIADIERDYVALIGADRSEADLRAFDSAWSAYLAGHDAWVRADPDHLDRTQARYGSALHALYKAADEATDALIDTNARAAAAEARAADLTADRCMSLVLLVCAAAGFLALLLAVGMRRRVVGPLGRITGALAGLAAGNRDVRVPEAGRRDEIGRMAKALEVFRANALALEQAHAATRAAQEQANALARHDALTGLPNRRVFAAELEAASTGPDPGAATCLVLLIDLDRFKPVNDLHGHAAGDMVLCEVARRLRDVAGRHDVVARLGGDEFAMIARSPAEGESVSEWAMRLAGQVVASLGEPIAVGDTRIEVGASVGVACGPADGTDAETLLRAADLAMYRAKADHRGTFRFFERSMDDDLRARAALEADLRVAVQEGAIQPYYQPLVLLDQQRVCGFEVLARWRHPVRGFVPPDAFIPLVEQLGLTNELTSSILRQACRDARDWGDDLRLAVNIWPSQLQDPVLPTRLMAILSQEGFAPRRLEVEVTESALVGDIETAKSVLADLRRLGITVALDDFGTGYSSLYHLRELQFDKLKIDRSFVQSMQRNTESEKIVDAVLSLARSLGLAAVAEGIETEEAERRLRERGCELGQGYLFSKAVDAEAVRSLLESRRGGQEPVGAAG